MFIEIVVFIYNKWTPVKIPLDKRALIVSRMLRRISPVDIILYSGQIQKIPFSQIKAKFKGYRSSILSFNKNMIYVVCLIQSAII